MTDIDLHQTIEMRNEESDGVQFQFFLCSAPHEGTTVIWRAMLLRKKPFAFQSNSVLDARFGSVNDPPIEWAKQVIAAWAAGRI